MREANRPFARVLAPKAYGPLPTAAHVPGAMHDLSGGVGYGFGYAFSPDMQITLVQEGFLSVHQRTGVAGGESTLGRQFILRLGTRFGF